MDKKMKNHTAKLEKLPEKATSENVDEHYSELVLIKVLFIIFAIFLLLFLSGTQSDERFLIEFRRLGGATWTWKKRVSR